MPSLLLAAPDWASPGCCWARAPTVTSHSPPCVTLLPSLSPSLLPALGSLGREGMSWCWGWGEGDVLSWVVAVVAAEKRCGLGAHPADDRSSGNDLFQGTWATWVQVVGSPWQWRRELSRGNLSYHRLKRTHFPHSTNSKKLYCPSPWLCNTKGVPVKHVLMAHVQPPRWLQRIHAERKKNIPKSNRKTSYANKALMSLEFETEDRHKIVLPAVQARQFTDQEGGG